MGKQPAPRDHRGAGRRSAHPGSLTTAVRTLREAPLQTLSREGRPPAPLCVLASSREPLSVLP